MIHTALSAIGWVSGGPVAVIEALRDAVGPDGTLVMPSHSGQLSDPANWGAPAVPADWVQIIRNTLPAFTPATTPTRGMGVVAELFRTWPGTVRSNHPHCSFAANGPLAEQIIAEHQLESPVGRQSPLAKAYELDATILLIGVGFDRCTMLHLAEDLAWPDRTPQQAGGPLLINGEQEWVFYKCPPDTNVDHFIPVGDRLIEEKKARTTKIGSADTITVSARLCVDTAVDIWRHTTPPQ